MKGQLRMDYKPGKKTSEFGLTAILAAIGSLFVYYGMAAAEEVQLWLVLAGALMAGLPTVVYTVARTWYKAKAEFDKP